MTLVVSCATLGATLSAGIGLATVSTGGAPIQACFSRIGGLVRVVAASGQCSKVLETPLTWNQKGAVGAVGVRGPVGAPGPTGALGVPGLSGVPGVTGTDGGAGVAGIAGSKGAQGDPCDSVAPACVGSRGDPGPTGPTGDRGPAGQPGTQFSRVDDLGGLACEEPDGTSGTLAVTVADPSGTISFACVPTSG
jgi:hypothetical protein